MSEPRRGTLARLLDSGRDALRDIVIVVLSILIAFGLDAWWDYRIDRRDEQDALANLREEFSYNLTQLQATLDRHTATRAAALELLRRATSEESLTNTEANDLLYRIMVTATYDPAVGMVTALLSSGQIRLIENDSLRTLIAGLPTRFNDAREDEVEANLFVTRQLRPFLRARLSFRELAAAAELVPGLATIPRAHDTGSALRGLQANPDFDNMILSRAIATGLIIRQQTALLDELERGLKLIDGEVKR